jgi:hypothetical protein
VSCSRIRAPAFSAAAVVSPFQGRNDGGGLALAGILVIGDPLMIVHAVAAQ